MPLKARPVCAHKAVLSASCLHAFLQQVASFSPAMLPHLLAPLPLTFTTFTP